MSFPVDEFGMNIRAEVKAFNFGFSPAKNLSSVVRPNDKIVIMSYTLPTHDYYRPNGLSYYPQNMTIIANSKFAVQAAALKRAFPQLRIFVDPRVHAKMTLSSSGKVWIGSANIPISHNSLDSTIGIDSPAVYAYFMDQIRKSGVLAPKNEVFEDDDIPPYDGDDIPDCDSPSVCTAADFEGLDDEDEE